MLGPGFEASPILTTTYVMGTKRRKGQDEYKTEIESEQFLGGDRNPMIHSRKLRDGILLCSLFQKWHKLEQHKPEVSQYQGKFYLVDGSMEQRDGVSTWGYSGFLIQQGLKGVSLRPWWKRQPDLPEG